MTSIRSLLDRHLVPGLTLLLIANGLLIGQAVSRHIRQQFDQGLLAASRSYAAMTEAGPHGLLVEFQEAGAPEPDLGVPGLVFEILRLDGSIDVRSPRLRAATLPPAPKVGGEPVYFDAALPAGGAGRFVALRFLPRPYDENGKETTTRDAGPAILVLGASRGQLDSTLTFLHAILAASVVILLGATILLVRHGLTRGLAPLETLVSELRTIDADRLGPGIDPRRSPLEVQPVVAQLNALLARLAASFERERAFSDHLAHELRTPIGELLVLSEVALQDPEDLEVVRPLLEDARATAAQMQRLVDDLLTLARFEESGPGAPQVEVPLGELVLAAWHGVQRQAAARRIELVLDGLDGVRVLTDVSLLELALSNLLDNAVEHGLENGAVRCSLEGRGGVVGLRVENRTAGLSASDLPHLFERFWRLDSARSGGRHAGLGLALVAALCRRLGLSYRADLEAGRFGVTLDGLRTAPPSVRLAGEGLERMKGSGG
jgi:signal transduction histidine kinase